MADEQEEQTHVTRRRGARWWPLGVIAVLTVIALVIVAEKNELNRQERNLQSWSVLSGAFLLTLIWFAFLSGLRWGVRLMGSLAVILMLATGAGLFRIRGVTGDLRPVLEWRWAKHSFEAPDASSSSRPARSSETAENVLAYPQFLGPTRNAKVSGIRLATDWSTQSPEEQWRRPLGAAWSGFAIQAPYAITQEQRAHEEMVACYDLFTGAPLWTHSDEERYATVIAGEGPRATPAIDEGLVFTQGATGLLNCLDLSSGELIWSKNIIDDNGASVGDWGVAGSPLVVGDLVIVNAGGQDGRSLAAYSKADGRKVWTGGDDRASYSSPALISFDGAPQVVMFGAKAVTGHDIESGAPLWSHPWKGGHPHVAIPVELPGDQVLVTSGYGTGAELLELKLEQEEISAERVWKSIALKAKFTNVVYHEGFIYGLDDGIMVCLDAETGRKVWKDGRYGHGQVILVNELMLVMAENGDVVLIRPNPEGLSELGAFQALNDKTWNPPALAGAYLVVRNDKEAACFKLPTNNEKGQRAL